MDKRPIYLDHSATTPTDPRVVEAMLPYFNTTYGNPSSVHRFGQNAEDAVEQARETVAAILNCKPREIIFTSCGSESDNLALRGPVYHAMQQGRANLHIITSPLEHSAISRTARQLQDVFGVDVTFLPVAPDGSISPDTLRDVLRDETVVVSIMYANNEIGTVSDIKALAAVAHEAGVLFHTDAVQATGQLPVDIQELGVDMLSISAHKLYGPKGVGVLYVREGTPILPAQTGGSHEFGLRSGTHNVPLIVGLATAMQLAYDELEQRADHLAALRDKLIDGMLSSIPDVELTGSREDRLPSHASFVLKNVDGNSLLMHLDLKGIAASSGSACKTGNPEPSDVLLALGYDREWALGGLRLSVGLHTTEEDIDYVLDVMPGIIQNMRKLQAMNAS
ncbi:MAG: cysteine desulfurase [Chloroflexi bacterium]|nr:cysteine desulfurase [Chloroflexota bacterium]